MSSQEKFVDILAPRRKSKIKYLNYFREVNPKLAYNQLHKPTPESHKRAVLESAVVKELILNLSATQNLPISVLEKQARGILDEIGYEKSLKLIRWLGMFLQKVLLNVSSGMFVNEGALLHMKSTMGSCPVVFVPSHRSYGDFILMSFVLFDYDVAIPAIAAGMDFQGMLAMGTMLRHTGAFYMRRSYNDDSLYWTTFKEYVHQLVIKGDLPIEFFIEGTRSRTGKSLVPKFGLINMILKAFFLSEVPDILFVPISISYERILEARLFAFELLGVPKPKESTSGFFKSLSTLRESFGNVYFNIAEPISAKQYFGEKLNRSAHSIGFRRIQELTSYEKSMITPFAYHIIDTQQKHNVLTVFNVVAAVVNYQLINGRFITVKDVIEKVEWLKVILEKYNAIVHIKNAEEDVRRTLTVHNNLVNVNEENAVALVSNVILDNYNVTMLKGHSLSTETMTYCVPFIMLQNYTNPILYHVADASIIVTILRDKRSINKDELYKLYLNLRSLFSQEFVSKPVNQNMKFNNALTTLLEFDAVQTSSASCEYGLNAELQTFLTTLIQPFVDAYYVILLVLIQVPVLDEKTVFIVVQKHFEYLLNRKELQLHPYVLSLDTISNCLNYLVSAEFLRRKRENSKTVYQVNGDLNHFLQVLDPYKTVGIAISDASDSVYIKNKL